MTTQELVYPDKPLHPANAEPGMRIYGLVTRQWRLMVIDHIGQRVACCVEVSTKKNVRPRHSHLRTAHVLTLSHTMRRALERLWFVYGNHGTQHTDANHHFIQHILEPAFVDLQNEFFVWSKRCSHECIDAVADAMGLDWYWQLLMKKERDDDIDRYALCST